MGIHTTTAANVMPGDVVLKYITDGHYYGTVSGVTKVSETVYEIMFTDGDSITRSAYATIYKKVANEVLPRP